MAKKNKPLEILLIVLITVSALLPSFFWLTFQNVPGTIVQIDKHYHQKNQILTVEYMVDNEKYTFTRSNHINQNYQIGDKMNVSVHSAFPHFTFTVNDAGLYYIVSMICVMALFIQKSPSKRKSTKTHQNE